MNDLSQTEPTAKESNPPQQLVNSASDVRSSTDVSKSVVPALHWIKNFFDYLGGSSEEPPRGAAFVTSPLWFGIWWGLLAGLILFFPGKLRSLFTSISNVRTQRKQPDGQRDWRRLFVPLGITLLILVVYNIGIEFTARKTQRRHLLSAIDHMPTSTECVFLGNSLVEAGCDASAFQSGWSQTSASMTARNLGLGATTPVEHYLILKRALSRPVGVKYVVYGFFDDQLIAPPKGDSADLIGNRSFSYYFPADAAAFYYPHSRLSEWQMEIVSRIPMFAERSSFWNQVEIFRRRLDEIGMPKQKMNRFGRVADFNDLDAGDVPSFRTRCNAIVRDDRHFSAPIQAIVDLANAHGVKVFFVEMPLSPHQLQTFYSLPVWAQMRAHLQALAQGQQVTYIKASDWVPDSTAFEDMVHLNEQGARSFSTQLGQVMSYIVATNQVVVGASRRSVQSQAAVRNVIK